MKNRPPPGPLGLKALEKTMELKGGPQKRDVAPVPPAKGAPVPPPPLWNYEGKWKDGDADSQKAASGASPQPPSSQGAASAKGATDAGAPESTAPASGLTKEQEAEDLAAIVDTNKAMDELYEQVALLEALVSQLPK